LELQVNFIQIINGGKFIVGSESCRFTKKGTITLHGNFTNSIDVPGLGKKVIGSFFFCLIFATYSFKVWGPEEPLKFMLPNLPQPGRNLPWALISQELSLLELLEELLLQFLMMLKWLSVSNF
jgi:hypothetical protein